MDVYIIIIYYVFANEQQNDFLIKNRCTYIKNTPLFWEVDQKYCSIAALR